MAEPTLDFAALRRLTGYVRQADVERCLKRQGIRYFVGRSGVWTTVDLVNAAGGIAANDSGYNAEEVL
jgi:hypothetical protein